MAYEYSIGATQEDLTFLTVLTIPIPEDEFIASVEIDTLGSGLQRDMGFPIINWHWGFLRRTLYDTAYAILRTYLTSRSGYIYIRSFDEDSLYWHDYYCIYRFPTPIRFSSNRALDLNVQFIVLETLEDIGYS